MWQLGPSPPHKCSNMQEGRAKDLTRPADPNVPVTPYFFVLYAAFRAASTLSSFLTVVTANSCATLKSIRGCHHCHNALPLRTRL